MASVNVNRVVLTGNLTRDPELKDVSEHKLCKLRLASNEYAKGEGTRANYFDVTVWGKTAENCARFLAKGAPVAIDGRLRWREWEQDDVRRQSVEIVADNVQFLGGGKPTEDRAAQSEDAAPTDGPDDIPFAFAEPPSLVALKGHLHH